MRTVFLDTVGLLALWDRSDQWHDGATAALERLGRETRKVTSSYVLLECGNAAARSRYRHLVDRLRAELEAGGKLIAPTEADWGTAWRAYVDSGIGGPGIVDHVSFTVMRRLGIREVFSNDRHFQAAGFDTLF